MIGLSVDYNAMTIYATNIPWTQQPTADYFYRLKTNFNQ